jgi:hypothetical protein
VLNPRLYAGDTFIAAPDCWWPDAEVAAEVDSREWHLAPGDWERTLARHDRMSSYGIIVMHFTPAQIRREPKAVDAMLGAALTVARDRPLLAVTARPLTAGTRGARRPAVPFNSPQRTSLLSRSRQLVPPQWER